jgi:phosphomannomutase
MDLKQLAQLWLEIDNSEEHAKEITKRINSNDVSWLQESFGQRLQFGTAGLRGEMGPGTNRMNRGMVQQTSLGIAHYVIQLGHIDLSVVIGYDARHNSREYALDAAKTFACKGFTVFLCDVLCATPLLAHAVVELDCNVGVMITASHNPPKDNGYKVYWNNGAQIIPPHDAGISKCIQNISLENVRSHWSDESASNIKELPESIIEHYLNDVQSLRIHKNTGAKLVYTPLHGVGTYWVMESLHRAKHDVTIVAEQEKPDGDFPTVSFPNPEEPGALDLAIDTAIKINADAVLANDPDADRVAIAIPNNEGIYTKLTGDQVGLLLSDYLLRYGDWGENPMVATTIVSSSQLADLAKEWGCSYEETLTGFKWIANKAIIHDKTDGGRFVIGFEEALGYSIGQVARDKDGVSAILIAADLISFAKQKGQNLWDLLIDIYRRHGLALSTQKSIKKPGSAGADEIKHMMNNLRSTPPSVIAGSKVICSRDYLNQTSTDATGVKALSLPKSNVLAYDLDDGGRVIVRPSGTEPKIKFYLEARSLLNSANEFIHVQKQVKDRLNELTKSILSLVE